MFRLAPGTEFIDKLTNGFAVFGTAFANPLPSFHPVDLLIGLIAGALLKLAVYVKGKNRKKFRQGEEYGSARWGKPEEMCIRDSNYTAAFPILADSVMYALLAFLPIIGASLFSAGLLYLLRVKFLCHISPPLQIYGYSRCGS